jgi:hypothetical protein
LPYLTDQQPVLIREYLESVGLEAKLVSLSTTESARTAATWMQR